MLQLTPIMTQLVFCTKFEFLCYITRYHLAGPDTGRVEVFADEMPGVPDNISPSSSGGFWIGFAFLRTNITSVLGKYTSIRNLIVKVRLIWVKTKMHFFCLQMVS